MMESRDLVSVSRLVSTPIFASLDLECFSSRLGLEGYTCLGHSLLSWAFEYRKEMTW